MSRRSRLRNSAARTWSLRIGRLSFGSVEKLVDQKQRRRTLHVEMLEDRRLLAAMRMLPGFAGSVLERNDDASSDVVSLGFEIDFFGDLLDELYVNNNGNVTFNAPLEDWTPDALDELKVPVIAPFWADVDTRNDNSGVVTYGLDTVDGNTAFGVNWNDVGYFEENADVTNLFQLVIIDRPDAGPGAFDIEFNYDRIAWDTGESIEFAAQPARAGFSASAAPGESYELIGSGYRTAFLDSDQTTGLVNGSLNSDVLGRYRFEVRGGTPLNELGLVGQAIDVGPGITYLGAGIPREFLFTDDIDNAVDTINADQVFQNGGLGLNLTGAGLAVGQWEGNVPRTTHQEFGGRVTIGDGSAGTSDHATAVAGVIGAGGGFQAGITRGVANQVNIISNDSTNMIAEMGALVGQIVASNHSFGQLMGWDTQNFGGMIGNREAWFGDRTLGVEDIDFGKYTQNAVDLDTVIAANANLLSVWSAGNDRNDQFNNTAGDNRYAAMFSVAPAGTVTNLGGGWFLVPNSGATVAPGRDGGANGFDSLNPRKTAKNNLVVGAVNDVTVDPVAGVTITNFSNFGPTDDGRVKPDVVANGAGLNVPEADNDSDYDTGVNGTSFAAPGVTGAVALLTQHYQNLVGSLPTAASKKAIVIHNALDTGNVGPDYTFGWGLVDVAASATFLSEFANPVPGQTRQLHERVLLSGVQNTISVDVTAGAPLKATLVWTDPAGTANAAGLDDATRVLVNDLDLTVTGPGGTFMPWTLNPAAPNTPAVRNARNSLDNVEQVVIDAPVSGTYTIRIGQTGALQGLTQNFSLLLSARQILPDAFEDNDTLATATVLGSEPAITLRDLTIDSDTDVDFFKYTAHDTGKLIVRALFTDADGNLDFRVRDASGDIIATASSTTDNEELSLPVVAQQMYFVEVFSPDNSANFYDLEIENFPAPPPTGVHLDPASDTGMMNNDGVTSDTTPTFFIQTDVLEFVDVNQNGLVDAEEIDVLTAAQAAAGNAAGVAVEVTLVNTTTGTSTTGFADPVIAIIPEVYRFTPAAALTPGVYLVSARLKIFDGRQEPSGTAAPAMGRSTASPPLWITIDTGMNVAAMVSADMITSSDTGMSNVDNVTNKMSPAFNGIAPAGFKVRLYANGDLVGQTVTGSDTSDVGRGAIGGIGGLSNDGLGLWEITSEPLADNAYNITLEVEDAAGNVTVVDPIFNPATPLVDIVVDTVEPNTPLLDLLDDTGRHDNDNVTKDNTPRVSMTSTDPNVALAQMLFTDNYKFRIFDRFENGAAEVLIYDSAQDATAFNVDNAADVFTSLTQLTRTLPVLTPANPAIVGGVLADGVHHLKLEVEDRAGNISHDFLLEITVDTAAPPVSFGLPDAASEIDGLAGDSDTGVTTDPATFGDRITSDTTPRLWGRAEADSIVKVFLDLNGDGVINPANDRFLGQTVAVPFDGNDAYPDGYWEVTSALDLNQIVGLPKDGVRRLLVTAEDLAGNPMPMNNQIADGVDQLYIFLDTQGPQITDVTVNDLTSAEYDLFDPKPTETGPTPLVNSLTLAVRDLPNRFDAALAINDFLYNALQADVAAAPGNYLLIGDHVGVVPIKTITVTNDAPTGGNPATATVTLDFFSPLPDDRYTLRVRDNLVDPANNKLDGESNAAEPQETPLFPTGDGVPGGDFVGRFTIDSRPEIGTYIPQQINLDINGNFTWDPGNQPTGGDEVNVDLTFTMQVADPATGAHAPGGFGVHDLAFAGKFGAGGGLLVGDNAIFVIDISGSTFSAFGGDPVGDQNGDGVSDTILDAEIAAFKLLNQQLIDRGLGNTAQVGIAAFETTSSIVDMDPVAAGVQLTTTPLADANANGVRDVEELLMQLNDLGSTNFEAGLQDAISILGGAGIAPGSANVIFLSDGEPNTGGSFADEAETIATTLGHNLRAFGVGPGASLPSLQIIDPTAVTFSNTNELLDAFAGGGGGGGGANGFDTLAVYGNAQDLGSFRWLIDRNSDGVINTGEGDILTLQPLRAGFDVMGAIPVAGDFDRNPANGDEIGLYKLGTWILDRDRDFVIETNGDDTIITGTLLGHPVVGDFDRDGFDDLGVFNNNTWFFDLAADGLGVTNLNGFGADAAGGDRDDTIIWGFPGVLDRPVAADMDQDGIDDIGLWVPRDNAQVPTALAEWYFLLSNQFDANGVPTVGAVQPGTVNTLDHPYEPVPFGFDLYAEFGNERALPIAGNFDPPVAASSAPPTIDTQSAGMASDFNNDGAVTGRDFLAWQRNYGRSDASSVSGDADGDTYVTSSDLTMWSRQFGATATATANVTVVSGDLIPDGSVNGADFLQWQREYGDSTTPSDLQAWQQTFGAVAAQAAASSGVSAPLVTLSVAAESDLSTTQDYFALSSLGLPSLNQLNAPRMAHEAVFTRNVGVDDVERAFARSHRSARRLARAEALSTPTTDQAFTDWLSDDDLAERWRFQRPAASAKPCDELDGAFTQLGDLDPFA